MKFSVIEGWGKLPDGWRYQEVAGAAVDKQDRVFCFTRSEVLAIPRRPFSRWRTACRARAGAPCPARRSPPTW